MIKIHERSIKRDKSYSCLLHEKVPKYMDKSNTAKGDIVNEAVPEMNKVERTMKYDENNINLDRAILDFDGLQHGMNRGGDKIRIKKEKRRVLQTRTVTKWAYKQQEDECHLWLRQKILPLKTVSVMSMTEQMVETDPGRQLET